MTPDFYAMLFNRYRSERHREALDVILHESGEMPAGFISHFVESPDAPFINGPAGRFPHVTVINHMRRSGVSFLQLCGFYRHRREVVLAHIDEIIHTIADLIEAERRPAPGPMTLRLVGGTDHQGEMP